MHLNNDILIKNLLKKKAMETPQRIFLQQAETDNSMTFQKLFKVSNQIGHGLRELGIKKGDTVLTMVPVLLESVYLWFGCCSIGAIEVPLNNAFKGNMLNHIVNDSKATVMFINQKFLERILSGANKLPFLKNIIVLDMEDSRIAEHFPTKNIALLSWKTFIQNKKETEIQLLETITFRDPACLLYTSGTTGLSKGVLWSYAQGYENAKAITASLGTEDAYYSPFPSNHISQKLFVYKMLESGGKVVLRNGFSVKSFWDDIRKTQCTCAALLGTMANFLYKQPEAPNDADHQLKFILMIPLIPFINEFRNRFKVKVFSFYNMTEICPVTIIQDEEIKDHKSCGRLREGFDAKIVDENDFEVPEGKVGELILRPNSPWAFMLGYWGRPDSTVESWQNLWMHTGDMFYRDNKQYLFYVDRKKDVIRRRGENISSMEVEREINENPKILESAVIGISMEYGEEEVKAIIQLKEEQSMTHEELIEFLKPRLPYFMIPRYVEFVKEIPKTTTQKIQKSNLRQKGITPTTWDREKKDKDKI